MKNIYFVSLILMLMIGCAAKKPQPTLSKLNIELVKSIKPPEHLKVVNQQSLMTGSLIVKDGCIYIYNKGIKPSHILLKWPWDTKIQEVNQKIRVYREKDPDNFVEVGSLVKFGGGASPINKELKTKCSLSWDYLFNVDEFKLP